MVNKLGVANQSAADIDSQNKAKSPLRRHGGASMNAGIHRKRKMTRCNSFVHCLRQLRPDFHGRLQPSCQKFSVMDVSHS